MSEQALFKEKSGQELYKERADLIKIVAEHKKAPKVPIVAPFDSWVLHYSGISVTKAFLENRDLLFDAFKKVREDMPFDGLMGSSNHVPLKMIELLSEGGHALYFVNDDGIQIKGSSGRLLEDGEYKDLLEMGLVPFMTNVMIPRKFEIFKRQTLEQNVDLLKKAIEAFYDYLAYNRYVASRIENELDTPIMIQYGNNLAPDIMLDYFRDFVGMSRDVRKYPDDIMAVGKDIWAETLKRFDLASTYLSKDKYVFQGLHFGAFMRPKEYEKIYYPFLKSFIDEICVKRGYPLLMIFQSDYTPYIEILQDIPSGFPIIAYWERGDYKKFKTLDDKLVFFGGIRSSVLKYGTKKEVEEHVKSTFDMLAPGGNFICSVEKSMMNFGDGTPENVKYAFELAEKYGRY